MNSIEGKYSQVVQKMDPHNKLRRMWELHGGISAQVIGLEVEIAGGQTRKMIVRQHGEVDRSHNSHVAATEFRLLQILHDASIPAPVPYYLDETCEILPIPYLVIEYIDGKAMFTASDPNAYLRQLATHLAMIHRVISTKANLSFLPNLNLRIAKQLGKRSAVNAPHEIRQIHDALVAHWPFPNPNQAVLLHGDYWPGNTLWHDEQLVAVIDWEDATLGDPLADLANSRLELLWALGIAAMNRFTALYQSIMAIDLTDLPLWDLYAALKPATQIAMWPLDDQTRSTMREGLSWFVAQALSRLSAAHEWVDD